MRIKVYDKYIFNQVMLATLVCILLFTIVWIAPETMLKIIQRTMKGSYTIEVAIQLLAFEIPKIMDKALPIGIFLGSLFTFDRLSKDSELTIFRSVGLSFWRILAPVIALSIIVTMICLYVSDILSPFSCNKLMQLKDESNRSNFVYVIKDKTGHPLQIVILPDFGTDGVKEPVIMNFSSKYYNDAAVLQELVIGEHAQIKENELIVMSGKKYTIDENGIYKAITPLENENVLAADKASILYELSNFKLKRERDLTNKQLIRYMKLLKQEELNDEFNDILNKFLQRYFHSFMCILFAILGCILGFSQPREQRLIGFTVAIGITFLYYITLPMVDMLAEKSILSPLVTSTIHPFMVFMAICLAKVIKDI